MILAKIIDQHDVWLTEQFITLRFYCTWCIPEMSFTCIHTSSVDDNNLSLRSHPCMNPTIKMVIIAIATGQQSIRLLIGFEIIITFNEQ